jgi:hypothetical protein
MFEEETMNDEATWVPTNSGDGPPVDFAQYFGERLCLPRAEALSLLGRCLLDYEPLERHESSER